MNNILNNIFSTYDFFLFEIFAIPADCRKEFLNKLLERKGSEKQKNVILLRYVYNVIDRNKPDEWEEEKVCRALKISPRMLDCHKSRILKSIREYYFRWDEIEKELRKDFKGDEIEWQMTKVRKMINIGMQKEAKHILLSLEKKLNKEKKNKRYYLMLSEVYEHLVTFYFNYNDNRKFNDYFKKAKNLYKDFQKSGANFAAKGNVFLLLKITMNYARALGTRFKPPNPNNITDSIFIYEELARDSKKAKRYPQALRFYHKASNLYLRYGDLNSSLKICKAGYELAKKKGLDEEAILFDCQLALQQFKKNNKNAKGVFKKIEKGYQYVSANYKHTGNLIIMHLYYLSMLIFLNKDDDDKEADRYITNLILFSYKAKAISDWYRELSDRYTANLCEWKLNMKNVKDYSLSVYINTKVLKDFEEINYETLIRFNKFYDSETLAISYINQIEIEFWKGTDGNFENAQYFIKKLERLSKTKHLVTNLTWLASLKIGINIFDDLRTKKASEVFDKYYKEIREFIATVTSEDYSYNMADVISKLIFISDRLKIKKLKNDVLELEEWLKRNRPELIDAIVEQANVSDRAFKVA